MSAHRPPWLYFLRLFLPLLLTATLLAYLFWRMAMQHILHSLRVEMQKQVELQAQALRLTFSDVVSDLRFVAGLGSLQRLVEEPLLAQHRQDLGEEFVTLTRTKRIYDQVRYLDESGMERVRSNLTREGAEQVPPEGLQDKGKRYYFRDAFILPPGEVFVSPMDLNIEHGVIEQPLKPMIRFGMPLFDSRGVRRGVLLFNYLAEQMLRPFRQHAAVSRGEVFLLNREGYWLAGGGPARDWGFMYPERHGTLFQAYHPEEWEQIVQGGEAGQFRSEHGLFTFERVAPLRGGLRSSSGSAQAEGTSAEMVPADEYHWYVVSHLPQAELQPTSTPAILGIYLFGVLVFALGAWRLTHSHQRLADTVGRLDAKVNELERTRNELVQSEKMASLGRLVAGFAHEINTPVGVAVGAASHLEEAVQRLEALTRAEEVLESDLDALLAEIRTAAELVLNNLRRASTLVMSFKRTSVDQSSQQRRRFLVCEMIDDTLKSLHNVFKRVPIEIEVRCEPWQAIDGVPGVYAQILTNLLTNSLIHGFDQGQRGGRIRITTEQDETRFRLYYEDDGHGMTPEVFERAFEPFFTTNREHGGSGLGLYVSYNLATAELSGQLRVESRTGGGVRFILEHPLVPRQEASLR